MSFITQLRKFYNAASSLQVKGKTFLFTGFRDKDLKKWLEDNGATVASHFSKQVNYVVTVNKNLNTLKMQKAKRYGAQLISVRELLDSLETLDAHAD